MPGTSFVGSLRCITVLLAPVLALPALAEPTLQCPAALHITDGTLQSPDLPVGAQLGVDPHQALRLASIGVYSGHPASVPHWCRATRKQRSRVAWRTGSGVSMMQTRTAPMWFARTVRQCRCPCASAMTHAPAQAPCAATPCPQPSGAHPSTASSAPDPMAEQAAAHCRSAQRAAQPRRRSNAKTPPKRGFYDLP